MSNAQDAPLYSFNQGEVSKIALARVDVAKMRLAAELKINWLPWVIGPMMMRPGLLKVGETLGDQSARLLRFIFSKLDTALIELTNGQMRVFVNEALVTRPAVATVVSDPGFVTGAGWVTSGTTSGATATIGGGVLALACTPIGGLAQAQQAIVVAGADQNKTHALRITVQEGPVTFRAGTTMGLSDLIPQTSLESGTHSLTCVPTGGTINIQFESTLGKSVTLTGCAIEAAGAMQVPAPWVTADLSTIRYDQSGDIIFIAAYGKQQYMIQRRAVDAWSIVKYRSNNGPFQAAPALKANFTPGNYYGNTTLLSDRPYFQTGHVGALFQLFSNGQFNATLLGGNNAFTPPVRVVGVGTASRNYNWTVQGTWAGTLTFQRSFDGPDSGFVDISTVTVNGTIASATGGTGGTPDLDNAICWERVGFKGGGYTSGSALVFSNYAGGGGFAIVRVTAFTSATQVTIEILEPFSSLNPTSDWLETDWSTLQGFPTSVTFHEGRLFWFGRDRIWGSQTDNFTGYAITDISGLALGSSGALLEGFGQGPVDSVNWGLSLTRLLCGREMSIASIRSSSFDEPLTPVNFSVKDCSTQGAARLPAIKIDKRGIFVQQSNRRVYELLFDAQVMDYTTHDLTRLNLDIGKPGFVDLDIARQPDSAIHFVRSDGMVAVLLYEPDDDVVCWFRFQTAGTIESVAVLPSATGVEDLVYYVVNRTVNGVTRRFIERLALRDNCIGGSINQIADCHVVYQGAPVTTLQITHLPNTTVVVWADGAALGIALTDGTGTFTMPDGLAHSNIVAGLGYTAQYQSAKLAYASQSGSALTKKKLIDHVGLVLFNTHYQGLSFGPDFNTLDPLPLVEDDAVTTVNTVWSEKDLPLIEFPGQWDVDTRLCLQAVAPYPAMVGAAVIGMQESDG